MRRNIKVLLFASVLAASLIGCARIGNPSGGPRDEEPPRFVRANPAPYSTDVKTRRVVIEFDEIVNVKDAFSKVVISPTSAQIPRVSSSGRRVMVDFQDTLMPNTTYTVDFGNSIEDNNESNQLSSFAYTFSTGPDIDTLRISGMVLGAKDLEPQQGMLVGVHVETEDSAFIKQRLVRVAKTDDYGRFTIRGLNNKQPYRIFALGDINNDFRWDNPDEEMAFYDELITPSSVPSVVKDTLWNLRLGQIDTIVERPSTRYLPDDILLNSFNLGYKPQYITHYDRPDSARVTLTFNAPSPTPPEIKVIGKEMGGNWQVTERSPGNDTITLWLRSEELIRNDTLQLHIGFMKNDSARRLVPTADTLRMITKKQPPVKKNKPKKGEVVMPDTIIPSLDMKILTPMTLDVYSPIVMEFGTPLDTLDVSVFRLEEKNDTLWNPVDKEFAISPYDSVSVRKIRIDYPWDYGGNYRFSVDTLAARGIYGLVTAPLSQEIKIKNEDEYANFYMRISGIFPGTPAFVELLDSKDSPVRVAKVENGIASFENVNPGGYYARLIEDFNGNGRFDTGDFEAGIQPEHTYYYHKKINLRKNWDLEQAWDVYEIPVDQQKPYALKKNKPKLGKNAIVPMEEEDDGYFDPTANPFDPNRNRRNTNNNYGY